MNGGAVVAGSIYVCILGAGRVRPGGVPHWERGANESWLYSLVTRPPARPREREQGSGKSHPLIFRIFIGTHYSASTTPHRRLRDIMWYFCNSNLIQHVSKVRDKFIQQLWNNFSEGIFSFRTRPLSRPPFPGLKTSQIKTLFRF